MNRITVKIVTGLLLSFLVISAGHTDDMRVMELKAKEKKAVLLKKVEHERQKASEEAEKSRERIVSDKAELLNALKELETRNQSLKTENLGLTRKLNSLVDKKNELEVKAGEMEVVVRELVGFIRTDARDLKTMVDQSPQSAFDVERGSRLSLLSDKTVFPGMDDIQYMMDLYFQEIKLSGEVRIETGSLINRSGEDVSGNILVMGNFTSAYQLPEETGFLSYSPEDRRLYALSKKTPGRMNKKLKLYMAGKSMDVPIDVSRGGALRQFTQRLGLFEQIPKGGPIVWPIIGILVLAVLIVIERLIFLFRKNTDTQNFMGKIDELILRNNWDECQRLCEQYKHKPLPNILLAGMNFRHMERTDMENAVQETILREIPPLERFLSTLGMLAAISPLLGLLGTVTGMINTFHVITYFGTGDPRMMSGGISEALVTTMLGLMVAIPIMFCHTLLSRRVENMIGELEEKAVAFINTVYKTRNTH